VDQISGKGFSKGILGRQRDEMRRGIGGRLRK